MQLWKCLGVATLAALLSSCADAAGEEEAERAAAGDEVAVAAIAAAGERLLDAYAARDLDGWLAGLSEEIVLMPPGEFMIVGLDAVREASRVQFGWLEQYETEIGSETLETVVAGDWAYTRAAYEVRYQPIAGGEPIFDRGRSLTIWQRRPDGSWLVARHISNRPRSGPS